MPRSGRTLPLPSKESFRRPFRPPRRLQAGSAPRRAAAGAGASPRTDSPRAARPPRPAPPRTAAGGSFSARQTSQPRTVTNSATSLPAATPGNLLKSSDAYERSATSQTRTRSTNNNKKKRTAGRRRPPFAQTRHQEAGSARAPARRRCPPSPPRGSGSRSPRLRARPGGYAPRPRRGTARLPAPGPAQEGRPPGVNGRHGRAGREESSGLTWISAGLVEPRRRRRRRLQVPAAHPSAPRHVSGVTPPAPRLLADFPSFFPPPAPPPARWRGQPSGTPARTAAACLPSAPAPGPPHFLTGNSR